MPTCTEAQAGAKLHQVSWGALEQHEGEGVEVSAVDPVASMQAINNPGLADVATQVRAKLRRVVEGL